MPSPPEQTARQSVNSSFEGHVPDDNLGIEAHASPAEEDTNNGNNSTEPTAADYNYWNTILSRPFNKAKGRAFLREVLAGLTTSMAMVPEVVSFSFAAGVSPLVGLQAAWIVCLVTGASGGIAGLVSGAAGALAVVTTDFVSEYGEGHLFIAVLMMGMITFVLGFIRAASLTKFVGTPVMMGFCNGLAIIIGVSQFQSYQVPAGGWISCNEEEQAGNHTDGDDHARRLSGGGGSGEWLDGTTIGWQVLVTLCTMLVVVLLPRFIKSVPSSLAGIFMGMIVEFAIVRPAGCRTPLVENLQSVQGEFPIPIWLDDRYKADIPSLGDLETWRVCFPLALTLSVIGLVESLMTGQLVGEMTDKPIYVRREAISLGVANMISGMFGGMGGCGMIGQTMVNVKSGGVTKISSVAASACLLLIILVAYPLINKIPMASLAGVMFVVVFHTFEWHSLSILLASFMPQSWRQHKRLRMLKKVNRIDAIVVILVTVVAYVTNLAYAVGAGVALTVFHFAWLQADTIELVPLEYDDALPEGVDSAVGLKKKMDDDEGDSAVVASESGTDSRENATMEVKMSIHDGSSDSNSSSTASGLRKRHTVKVSKDTKVYELHGPLFFANATVFRNKFEYQTDPKHVELHFHNGQIVDYSALNAINSVARKYQSLGKKFRMRFVKERSMRIIQKASKLLYLYDKELGEEVLSKELIAISEVPTWTVPDGYQEEESDGEKSSVANSVGGEDMPPANETVKIDQVDVV